MRVAVYTNTRVTFQCCTSVHKGFVTAFRGGQVLGFVLVGGGVLNIMIIIFIFKAGWYNGWLKELMTRGVPVNNCPGGGDFTNMKDNYAAFKDANTKLATDWGNAQVAAYKNYLNSYQQSHATKCPTAFDFSKDSTVADVSSTVTKYNTANANCHADDAT